MRSQLLAVSAVAFLWLPLASDAGQAAPKPAPAARPATARPAPAKASPTATASDIDQIIELARSGVGDNLIVKTVQNSGKVYTLAPTDVLRLKKAGVSEPVIEAMLDTGSHAKAVAPAPAPAPAQGAVARAPATASDDVEPTEAEMMAALKAGVDNANALAKTTEAQCRSGAATSDPALAMMCLAGAMGTQGRGGIGVQMTGFRKIACARALNVPGWNCDYTQSVNVSGIAQSPFLQGLMQDNVVHGRFLKTNGRWVRIE
jgi:hypothetical protein